MEIIVCVKQVPGTSQVEVDPVTGVLKRDGVDSKLNPYDLFALELAYSLCEKYGGRVRTLSMGPPQAKAALLETLYMGADSAVLLSDRKFAGADVAATSYTLKCGIEQMGEYDLILCGKQTTDGDTAQVGPEMAEMLGIEHAANVCEILEVTDKEITVCLNLDDKLQFQRMQLPCLLSVEKDINTPRLPSYKRMCKVNADGERVAVLTFEELSGAELARCGLKGSPTQVERIFPPEKNADKQMLHGSSAQLSDALGALLKERKFI
ncbi:MAG: Acryloyl-CoA reductase electron transfer subunit gamma [Firmicutes bacterium ADurb.Bin182]|nr:MAG: Acryloyl-CoA reductase electron transfer subunit gamma [Firmicutes bacterium ADurb.Bin182]